MGIAVCFAAMEACRAHPFNSTGKVVVHNEKKIRFLKRSRAKPPGFLAVFLIVFVSHTFAAEPVNTYCPVTPEEPAESWITTEYEGQTIGFCCKSCLRKFNADPGAYLANLPAKASASGAQELPTQTSGGHGTSGHRDADASNGLASSSGGTAHTESKDSGGHAHVGGEEADSAAAKGSEAETGSGDHDHATDHGSTSGKTGGRILAFLGKLHVLAVHLPIALLPLAGLLELIGMRRKSANLHFAAALNFILGGLAAWAAAALGWIAASQSNYSGELGRVLFWHRWMGVGMAVIVLLGMAGLALQRRAQPWGRAFYRIALFALLALVPLAAHFGGSLVYGPDYLFNTPVPGIPTTSNP